MKTSMAEPDFEKVKKIVRSVLLPCQRGCTLKEFLRSYRELNGINLPYVKLGYNSDLHLLQNMPDAVIIQQSRTGEYVLSAVADESTQHIQKMVSKQKPPKKRVPSVAPVYGRSYTIPPRFVQKTVAQKHVAQVSKPSLNSTNSKKVAPLGLQNKIKKLVSRFPSGLSLSHFLKSFERVNGEPLKFRSIGFFTLEECLETVPNIYMKTVNNDIYVFPNTNESSHVKPVSNHAVSGNNSYSQVAQSNIQETSMEKLSMFENTQDNTSFSQVAQSNIPESRAEKNSKFKTSQDVDKDVDKELKWKNISFTPNNAGASGGSRISSKPVSRTNSLEFEQPDNIPPFVLRNLQKLADMYPNGIRATEFPSIYEKVINTEFDLHCLGFNDLSVFIDAVPNIFKRADIIGLKKNWLIVPAGKDISEPPNKKELLHDTIISNIRTLLEGSPEGIWIDEFLYIYSTNCSEPLCIGEFGFTSLESFLMNNANQVPLRIASGSYGKCVYLLQAPELQNTETQLKINSEPQSDVVLPGMDIFCVKVPEEIDTTKFFPVEVQAVETPSSFYVQLKLYEDKLIKLNQKIERFYQSSTSDLYTMKSKHVKVNTVCMAMWPKDKLWYRAIITSIPSLEEVKVFYFDYGTKDTIPINMLRYMKKEFSTLPAQALLSKLACLKPVDNSEVWSQEAKEKMLSLVSDNTLMAKIHSISDNGILSLVLCDTNGDSDVFLNDELLEAGLAVARDEELEESDITQALGNPLAVGFQALSLNSYPSFIPPPAAPIPAPIAVPSCHLPSTSDHFPSTASCLYETSASPPSDNEMFLDDDELFEKFYEQTVTSVMKRYVKRVRTVDAYIFHIICVEGEPFVSCGDISNLIWDKKDVNYLFQRLQNRQCNLPSLKTLENKINTEMFYQFERFGVKGCQKINEFESQILVCPLSNVIEILNLLGQPSAELRRQIQYELENFNPSEPAWMELSEGQIPDLEEVVISTEDDKLNRLCLYDLIAMKESIRLRAERVQNNIARGGTGMDEIMKLEQLVTRVIQRINKIKEIIQEYIR